MGRREQAAKQDVLIISPTELGTGQLGTRFWSKMQPDRAVRRPRKINQNISEPETSGRRHSLAQSPALPAVAAQPLGWKAPLSPPWGLSRAGCSSQLFCQADLGRPELGAWAGRRRNGNRGPWRLSSGSN